MGRGQWIVVLALAGCDELAGIGTPGPAQSHCVIGGLDLCLNAEPQNPLSIDADLTLNTNTDCSVVHYVPPQPSLCVIYASDVAINAKLFATGSRPLVIAATNTITITGSVDVSSYRSKSAGAAANDATCMTWSRSGIEYGGGAGGSFIGAGGAGGEGYNRDPGTQPGPTHAVPSHPRGGCPGSGGFDNVGGTGGAAGRGGGAVWLAAGTAIVVNSSGRVLALGGGGSGGGSMSNPSEGLGASGGGSGGFIRLAAPALTIAGIVAANGGGGSEGGQGSQTAIVSGMAGEDGLASAQPAKGGAGAANLGGDGGAGGAMASGNGGIGANAAQGTTQALGGGGGGGVGYIQFVSESVIIDAATISPTAR